MGWSAQMTQARLLKLETQVSTLSLNGVIATRGSFQLGPIDTVFPFGQITVVVGANGAGKTTLTRVLLGQIPHKKGEIRLDDNHILPAQAKWRSTIGFLSDDPNELLVECTAEELWHFCIGVNVLRFPSEERPDIRAGMIKRAHELADMLHFLPPSRQPIAEYSLGMRKKSQLIAALATDPDVIILDEPRNGLDPIGIEQVHRLLHTLVTEGKLVIIATHDLSWALAHSHRFLALRAGEMVLASETTDIDLRGGESYLLEKLSENKYQG